MAILAVLAFHAGIPQTPGGFVGVDVFFVISGFLITGLLLREFSSSGRIDLTSFYARRARRLLPAALIVIAVTVAASAFILSSIDLPAVAGDGAAAALYVSNYRFALTATDYFAADTTPSPLLHYWSLAVEEQFYLFWPLLVLVGARLLGVARLWWLVAAVAVTSFALSVVVTNIEAPWAFYSLPTRAWQLALGGLIALGILSMPTRFSARIATVVGGFGMALIVAGVVLIDPSVPFPGFAALLPAVGAALLIVSGERASSLGARVLATPPMRWIGRISYSLYLWHWPLLILLPELIGRDSLPIRIVFALAAIVVADLSTRFIEGPFRFGRAARLTSRRTLALSGALSFVVALGALVASGDLQGRPAPVGAISSTPLPPGTRPTLPQPLLSGPLPDQLRSSLQAAADELPRTRADGCQPGAADAQPRDCVYGDPDASTTVALIGDSHAGQWLPALEVLAEQRRWRIIPFVKGNCPVVDLTVWHERYQRVYHECDEFRELALQNIAEEQPAIVFVGFTRFYEIVGETGRSPIAQASDTWADGLVRALERIGQSAERVVLFADTPRHATHPLRCLARSSLIELCEMARSNLLDDDYATLEAEAAERAGAELISANDWLCGAGTCPLIMGDHLLYRDTNHITTRFMEAILAPQLAWALDH